MRITRARTGGFVHVRFDVEIRIDVDPANLSWPDEAEAAGPALSGNQQYMDLRGLTWAQAQTAYAAESSLLRQIDAGRNEHDLKALHPAVAACGRLTWGLDLGTASTVAAVSAAGLIPAASCNGGAFGGAHFEPHPLVSFFAKPAVVPLLTSCARSARIGLGTHRRGTVVAYSDDIRRLRAFARELMGSSNRGSLCKAFLAER